jgi:hypothetical protein
MADIPAIERFEDKSEDSPSRPAPQATSQFLSFSRGQRYYTSWSRRIGDLAVGIVGFFILTSALGLLLMPLYFLGLGYSYIVSLVVEAVAVVLIVVLAVRYGRSWLGYGAIVSVVLSLFVPLFLLAGMF